MDTYIFAGDLDWPCLGGGWLWMFPSSRTIYGLSWAEGVGGRSGIT